MRSGVILVFCLLCTTSFYSQSANSSKTNSKLRVEPIVGVSMLTTTLNNNGYFLNYESVSASSLTLGVNLVWHTGGGFAVESGVIYASHNVSTDSLNIPPTSSPEIFSVINFDYSSVNVPFLLSYNIEVGNKLIVRPRAGIVTRFMSAHDYNEEVMGANIIFNRNIDPATDLDYESFGVATQFGVKIGVKATQSIFPFMSVDYFNGTSNFEFLRGTNTASPGAQQRGNISNKGLLLRAGLSIPL